MENKPQKLIKEKLNILGVNKKNLVVGSIVATIIAVTPYLSTLWESVPSQKTWDTFFGLYSSNYYEDIKVLAWTLLSKFIPLILLFIWIFTCRHWWYHILLVPIAMYIFEILDILNSDIIYTEKNLILYMLPVMVITVPSIYLIRARIFNKINEDNKSLEELEEEFKATPKNFWEKVKQYF